VVLATADENAREHFVCIPHLVSVTSDEERIILAGTGDEFITNVIQCLSENRIKVTEFRTVLPTLEDVFLRLTGHSIRD
jgi:ABC-2 type transport system ATP-binding protein